MDTLPTTFELCDMTPTALWTLAVSEARKPGASMEAIGAEVLRRMSFAPLPMSGVHDCLLTRKEVRYLLGIRDRKALWNMEKKGLVFIRGQIRLSALADWLVAAEQAKRRFQTFRRKQQEKA
jgi:hypothetical protein